MTGSGFAEKLVREILSERREVSSGFRSLSTFGEIIFAATMKSSVALFPSLCCCAAGRGCARAARGRKEMLNRFAFDVPCVESNTGSSVASGISEWAPLFRVVDSLHANRTAPE